jgi:nucleotide-binding universal stress UspA family protein
MNNSPQHRDPVYDASAGPAVTVAVVGVDGSDSSWDALCWVCGETKRLGGRTVAVLVDPPFGGALVSGAAPFAGAAVPYVTIQQSMTDQAEELGDQVRAYALDRGVDVTFVRTCGDTARELLRVAEADHADLIVVGRSSKFRHHLAGSLGRRLVGRSGAPIIVVVP